MMQSSGLLIYDRCSYVFYRETAIKITRKKYMVKFNVFNIARLCPEEAVFKIQLN